MPGVGNLEQFVALAASAKGLAAVQLVREIVKHPSTFVFGDLLAHPNIREMENSEHRAYYRLLQIFAYGTYADYKSADPKLPELDPAALAKLKKLTIMGYCAKHKTVACQTLMEQLDVGNVRELEDMIIDCAYEGLVVGKLDQRKGVFEVQHALARDIGPRDIVEMGQTLDAWLLASERLLSEYDALVARAEHEHILRQQHAQSIESIKVARAGEVKQQQAQGARIDDAELALLAAVGVGPFPPQQHSRGRPDASTARK